MLCMHVKNGEKNGRGGESGREVTHYRNDNRAGGMVVGQTMEHYQIGISSTGESIVKKTAVYKDFPHQLNNCIYKSKLNVLNICDACTGRYLTYR